MKQQFKSMTPFLFAGLLLSLAIAVPILFFHAQDKALLHKINAETIPTGSVPKSGISIVDRLKLMNNQSAVGMYSRTSSIMDEQEQLKSDYIQQILKEVEKLQALGGFPSFDLYKDLVLDSNELQKNFYISSEKWDVSVYEVFFSAANVQFGVRADADTYTIYQYEVKAPAAILNTVDEKTIPKIFSDYLSISQAQYRSFYSFSKRDKMQMKLKAFAEK